MVTYYHENFHSQRYFITVSGVILSYSCCWTKPRDSRLFSFLSSSSLFHLHLISVIFLGWPTKYCFILKHLVDTILYCVIMAETLATGGAETQIKTAVRRPRALSAWLGNKSTDILWSCPVLQEHSLLINLQSLLQNYYLQSRYSTKVFTSFIKKAVNYLSTPLKQFCDT